MARIVTPLTDRQCQKFKEKGKALADGGGLYLQCLKDSGGLSWRFRYKSPVTQKMTKIAIGDYPAVTLAQARQTREEYQALLAQGIDPRTHREQAKAQEMVRQSTTFKAMAQRWREKKKGEIEPLTLQKDWRRIELYLLPHFASTPVSEVLPRDVFNALAPLEKAGKGDTLKRTIRLLNEILNYAVVIGALEMNPCLMITKAFSKQATVNNPTLKPDELPQFLGSLFLSPADRTTQLALLWQLLTMTCPQETTNAKWAEIDEDLALWIIPAERMKKRHAHTVPLTDTMRRALKQIKILSSNSDYLFPSRSKPNQPLNKQTPNKTLRDIGYQGKLTAHGLRSIASTYMHEQGIDKDVIELCLSHKIGGLRGVYNRAEYLDQRRTALTQWNEYVERALNQGLSTSALTAL
ncbi:tyrosine-type recombinase/integrase [Pasteurellaceae bacterium HPA106]|uniref:tyrosine-type recombinase/integrase n=1 Tax=Spirabiliibacterium pneumoniae TaxID=221400 RepID=UPI001AACD1B1|nr:integrase arm-type DNA-binding domain-containing protein [Spirabiliibacterium pneumoniae]MBE2897095.1 tyrosine-type recombinase/integrase [Spirabiliibacterium pneumoniae]